MVDSMSVSKKVHGKDPIKVSQEYVVVGPSNIPKKNDDSK